MSTVTKPTTTSTTPAEKPENGVPTAARPAPAPTPAPQPSPPVVDDEELFKEAAALEEAEAPAVDEQTTTDAVSIRLFDAAKEVTDEIEECDKVIAHAEADYQSKLEQLESEHATTVEQAEARRDELRVQFQNALNKMQESFGVTPKKRLAAKPAVALKPRHNNNGKSIRALILEYLENNRHARTSEIRSFLQAQGRPTNPGVELSRMVKDGSIINKERGMYIVGKSNK